MCCINYISNERTSYQPAVAVVEEAEKAGGNAKTARQGGRSRSSAEAAEEDELEADL
jgi:hypothetical protein